LHGVGGETFLSWLGGEVLLFANADEAAVLCGITEPAAAAAVLAGRTGQAVVKRGASGALWSDGSGVRSVPAPATEVVDSTGAGDAFAAGFLAQPGEVADRLANAVRLAARAVTQVGARPVNPNT
jgi:sugar/nucleoside kinase (ribokinase family)